MPTMSDLRTYLTFVQIGTHVLLLTKLFRAKLLSKYQYFGMFLGFELLRLTIVSFVQLKSSLYAHFYFATQPMLWTLFVLMMLELFQLVLRNHPGIASLGRKALTWSLMASALTSAMNCLSICSSRITNRHCSSTSCCWSRLVMTSLLLLILCLTLFLSYFPVPLTGMRASMHVCWRHTSR